MNELEKIKIKSKDKCYVIFSAPQNDMLINSCSGITEEGSPKGVLKRQENDLAKTKSNSGYRSSPRASVGEMRLKISKQYEQFIQALSKGGSDSESASVRDEIPVDPLEEDMDVDVAKTSTQPTTSPRKVLVKTESQRRYGHMASNLPLMQFFRFSKKQK